ncbi:hypothetical protein MKZ38_010295 [Zalerion maritima]|uniref:Uncharacterized protein n=1 Tax=Zalerion maritima TaxID=339359 RepID=A0AAD5WUJ8_9PEZI|nr:hypothetical protein MKZ38_010295 [Zalerion maritima]
MINLTPKDTTSPCTDLVHTPRDSTPSLTNTRPAPDTSSEKSPNTVVADYIIKLCNLRPLPTRRGLAPLGKSMTIDQVSVSWSPDDPATSQDEEVFSSADSHSNNSFTESEPEEEKEVQQEVLEANKTEDPSITITTTTATIAAAPLSWADLDDEENDSWMDEPVKWKNDIQASKQPAATTPAAPKVEKAPTLFGDDSDSDSEPHEESSWLMASEIKAKISSLFPPPSALDRARSHALKHNHAVRSNHGSSWLGHSWGSEPSSSSPAPPSTILSPVVYVGRTASLGDVSHELSPFLASSSESEDSRAASLRLCRAIQSKARQKQDSLNKDNTHRCDATRHCEFSADVWDRAAELESYIPSSTSGSTGSGSGDQEGEEYSQSSKEDEEGPQNNEEKEEEERAQGQEQQQETVPGSYLPFRNLPCSSASPNDEFILSKADRGQKWLNWYWDPQVRGWRPAGWTERGQVWGIWYGDTDEDMADVEGYGEWVELKYHVDRYLEDGIFDAEIF